MTTEEDAIVDNHPNTETTAQKNENHTENAALAVENQYFYEDLVYRITDKRVSFGMVVDNYEDNDSDSDEDNFDFPPLSKGSVKVSWYPLGCEQVIKERTIGLADRSLMPGDVVRRLEAANNKDTQHGYCREIIVNTDVQQLKTKNVLCSVSNSRLFALDRYELHLVACLGPWVGSVKEHRTLLTVAILSCNPLSPVSNVIARFELTHTDVCNLKPAEKRRWARNYSPCEHYIGQILTVKPSDLKHATWIHGAGDLQVSKKKHHLIIEDLKSIGVGVRWHCQGLADDCTETIPTQPDYLVTGEALKNLKMLNVFETCTSQMGDRNYLTVTENDVIEPKSKWVKRQSKLFKTKANALKVDTDGSNENQENKNFTEIITENLVVDVNGATDDGEWSTEESDSSSGSVSGSSGRVTPILNPHHNSTIHGKKSPVLSVKLLGKKMKKERKLRPPSKPVTADTEPPKPGQPIIVETLRTSSVATVVWQDGTVEKDIPSTQLYPIHHLDYQEFFPGDFVIKNDPLIGNSQDLRDYGVVQYMNHDARTAVVKWFRTYAALLSTKTEQCSPSTHGESEVSVYDLKDHPDFNFRPGTVVVRVAGSSNIQSAAGQVLDNFPEGHISVMWVDGSQSTCWPQDLYRVGDYDSDEGELWDDEDDEEFEHSLEAIITPDASWETQSEDEVICDTTSNPQVSLRHRLAANIERSCDAMARLEDMFTANPALQGREVMRKLLEVYKDCRFLDRLMGTSIFHEQHFTALLERATKSREVRSSSSVSQRMHQQYQRLFSAEDVNTSTPETSPGPNQTPTTKTVQTFSGQTDMDYENNLTYLEDNLSPTKSETVFMNSFELLAKQCDVKSFVKDSTDKWTPDSSITPISKTAEILSNIVNVRDTVKIAYEKDKGNDTPKREVNPGDTPETKEFSNKLTLKTLYLRDALSSCSNKVSVSSQTEAAMMESESASKTNSNACKTLCKLIKVRLVIAHAEVLKRLGTAEFIHTLRNETDKSDEVVSNIETIQSTPAGNDSVVSNNSCSNIIETPDGSYAPELEKEEGFTVLEHAPTSHKYHLSVVQPPESQSWIRAVRREFKLLSRSLPPGVWVRGYEDRLDILSVMIRGPPDTPYEDGLFLFDVQLGANYPVNPPLFHYVSYCNDRLNPNLYEDGKVCVSLLGTWSGRASELWGPESTLLQVIVSIQGLILNAQPYFNEAGYERQKGSALGKENSRMYNEMATLKLVQSMTKLIHSPPEIFKKEVIIHFKSRGLGLLTRLEKLLTGANASINMKTSCSQVNIGTSTSNTPMIESTTILDSTLTNENIHQENDMKNANNNSGPAFPLLPASKGFCLSLQSALPIFKESLIKFDLLESQILEVSDVAVASS